MKKLIALVLALMFAVPSFCGQWDVSYVGGTVANLKEGNTGKLDTSSQKELAFVWTSGRVSIPYLRIDSYELTEAVAHHLGVLPAIAVSLLKKRQKRHFLRIAYRDENMTPQVAIFEVSKTAPMALLPILRQRAPQSCEGSMSAKCRTVPN